jgi:tape measure domain-containing protein
MFSRLGGASVAAFGRMRAAGMAAFRALTAGFRGLRRVAGTFIRTFTGLLKIILGLSAGFTIFAKSITESGNQINKFVNTLVVLKGNSEAAAEELKFLFEIANRLGTSFTAAATPFTKFAAAAAGTISDQSIRDVFESFATVGVALQLTQSEVTGVFLALQQIASKGVVSMEELRLQLAERVPGAMRLAAQSMGMTMIEFEKAVATRSINAGVFLENFAAKLKDVFGLAAELASERLFADIQRLGNAFVAFRQKIFVAGFQEGLTKLVQAATNFLNNNPELAGALGRFSEQIFDKVSNFLNNLTSARVINILNTLISTFESLVNALNLVAFHLRKLFDENFGNAIQEIESRTANLNSLLRERNQINTEINLATTVTSFDEGILPEGITDERLIASRTRLSEIETAIINAKGALVEARNEALNFGVQLEELPMGLFDQILGKTAEIGPIKITFDRIEPLSMERGGDLDLSNQPSIEGQRGDIQAALEEAEILNTMRTPEFFDSVISGEIRNAMDDLVRMTHDYNVLLEAQETLLNDIKNREELIEDIRNREGDMKDASELNELLLFQNQAIEKYKETQEDVFELEADINKELEKRSRVLDKIKSFQEALEESFTTVQDVFINMIKKTEDAIAQFVATGELNFRELANSIIADLTRMATQAFITRFILGPLLGGFVGNLGNTLGGTMVPGGEPIGPTFGMHTGGIVGGDRLERRNVFDRLRSNEQPIIAQRGEGVFTQGQMKALAPLSAIQASVKRSSSASNPPVNVTPIFNVDQKATKVEIINNTPAEATVETTKQGDGTELIRVIIGAVATDIARDGQLARILKGKFGLKNTTGLR